MNKRNVKWAVRCWYWKAGADTSADVDPAHIQEQKFRRVPNEGLADAWGRKMAVHPLVTSPGLYDVMRGYPDAQEWGGIRWEVYREVRP